MNVVVEGRIVEHPIHATEDVFQNRRECRTVRIGERLECPCVYFREQPRLEREARRVRLERDEPSVLGDDAPSGGQLASEDFAEQALALPLLGVCTHALPLFENPEGHDRDPDDLRCG